MEKSQKQSLLPHEDNKLKSNSTVAFLYMLMGSITMGLMNFLAKLIREWTTVTSLQVSLFRAFGMTFGSFTFCKLNSIDILLVPRDVAHDFLYRCIFGYVSVTCMFVAIFLLPFSLAMVLNFTQPVAAAAINFVFGGEKLNKLEYLSIFFAMLGVVIMTNPTVIFFWIDDSRGFNKADFPHFNLGVLAALTGSISSGFAYLSMRRMGKKIDSQINPLYFGMFSIITGVLINVSFGHTLVQEFDWLAIGLLTLMSFFGWTAQVGVTKALSLDKAGRVAALNYLQVVMAWIFDVTCFGAVVQWTDMVGTIFIIGFTFIGALNKFRTNSK